LVLADRIVLLSNKPTRVLEDIASRPRPRDLTTRTCAIRRGWDLFRSLEPVTSEESPE
jgi:hypothetical protein